MRIGMADDHPREGGPFLLEDAQLVQADGRLDGMGRDRETGPSRRPRCRPMDALFLGGQPWLVGPDLADDPGPGVDPRDTFRRVADDLVGERLDAPAVDPGLRRVV